MWAASFVAAAALVFVAAVSFAMLDRKIQTNNINIDINVLRNILIFSMSCYRIGGCNNKASVENLFSP